MEKRKILGENWYSQDIEFVFTFIGHGRAYEMCTR